MQVEGTRLYRVRDVAEHFDVSVATIYRAIESGQLRAMKLGVGSGTFRVSGAAVRAYAEACVRAAYRVWFPAGDVGDQASRHPVDSDTTRLGGPGFSAVVSHEH